MKSVDWKKLILNKENLYKILIGTGLAALATSAPVTAPVAVGLKLASTISTFSTLFGAAKEGIKRVLDINP